MKFFRSQEKRAEKRDNLSIIIIREKSAHLNEYKVSGRKKRRRKIELHKLRENYKKWKWENCVISKK